MEAKDSEDYWNQFSNNQDHQLKTIAQMEKVKNLEEELAKEQSRLQAMISHLQVEGLEKSQKTTQDSRSKFSAHSSNFLGTSYIKAR